MKAFALTALGVEADANPDFLRAQLTGTGLRPEADIWVNDRLIHPAGGMYEDQEEAVYEYMAALKNPPKKDDGQSPAKPATSAPKPSEEDLASLRKTLAEEYAQQVCEKRDARAKNPDSACELGPCDDAERKELIAKRIAALEDIGALYRAIKRKEINNTRGKSKEEWESVIKKYAAYEQPAESEDVKQDSTGSYRIRFKKDGGPVWNVRFRQKNVRGYDEGSLTQQFPPATPVKPFEIRHYVASARGANAEVDLRFFNTVPPIPDSVPKEISGEGGKAKKLKVKTVEIKRVEIHPNEGTYPRDRGCTATTGVPPCQIKEDDKRYRARFLVYPHVLGSHKLDRDTITVTVHKEVTIEYVYAPTKKDGDPPPLKVLTAEVMDIALPIRPQITRVANSGTGKPSGFADQETTAIIEGVNLDAIKKIFFGTQQAEIVGVTDNDSAIVKVPKLAALPKGESVTVPITVEMKSDFFEGKALTAGYYEYVGQPVPIDVGKPVPVVVRPRPYRGKPLRVGSN